MTDITIHNVGLVNQAMAQVGDRSLAIEDRAALYALLYTVQLRINRVIRTAKDDLIVAIEQSGERDLGPLSVKSTAIDVAWPCNDEANWTDVGVQDAMRLYAHIAPEYFRHVPEHYEVRTAALGAGMAEGDPVAQRLHRELKDKGWRTEVGRRLSLAVREVKAPKKEAA